MAIVIGKKPGRSTLKAIGEGRPDRKHGPHDQL